MILVPDTNIYISAIISPLGNAGFLYTAWKKEQIQLALSDSIIAELKSVLSYAHIQAIHKRSSAEINEYIEELSSKGTVVKRTPTVKAVLADPTDDKFLSCAVAVRADAVVSGDHHLLSLGSYRGIPIITPKVCVDLIKN